MKTAIHFFSIALLLSLAGSLFANPNSKKVVATVNGTPITEEELERTYTQNLFYVSDKTVTKKKVLNNLINRILGIQKAKKNKLQNNALVRSKMEDVLYHAQISKDLEGKFKKIKVKDQEVKKYYKKNPEYRTAHILFRMRAKPSENEWKAALVQAKKVYVEVNKRPSRFGEFAKKYGQTNNAPQGGEMGFIPGARLAPQYYRAVRGKKVGYITPPVRTQFGYHIIKVLGVKKFKDINVPLYKKLVYDTKRDKVLDNYFKGLRRNASVKLNIKLD